MSNRNLFLTALEVGNLRSGCQPGQMRVLFWVADFSLDLHIVEGGASVPSGVSF